MTNLARSLVDLEGIGPAIAETLGGAALHVIGDLVRLPAADLHAIVASQASRDDAERWQAMAWLLHVDALTPQWAEALVAGGVDKLEELLDVSLADLQALFVRASADGIIRGEPDAGTLLEIVRDAATLHWSGRASFLVRGEGGAAIEGAIVRVGACRATTDARGRCQVVRIPAADGHALSIQHEWYEDHFEEGFAVSHDSRRIDVHRRQLSAATATSRGAVTRDEFEGDDLPALGSYRAIRVQVEPDAIRDREVLCVHEVPASAGLVSLVSIHRAFRAGELLVRHVKLPREQLPPGCARGDLIRHLRGSFSAAGQGIAALEAHRARGKARARLARDPQLGSLSRAELLHRFYREYGAAHAFSAVKRRGDSRNA